MSQGSNGLHLDGVPLFQGMVKDTGRVNNLPTEVLVVSVTHVQGFGGKCVRLNFDIGSGDLVDETRFANIGKATDEQSSGIGIDGWETTQMLPNLFEIGQALTLPLHDGGHSSQRCSLELFAPVQ